MQASLKARPSRQEDRSAQSVSVRAPKLGHPILQLQRDFGNQTVQRFAESGFLQAKLKISQAGDPYEQEADRIADRVVGSSDFPPHAVLSRDEMERRARAPAGEGGLGGLASPLPSFGNGALQRKCAGCEGGAPCAECEEEMQRGSAVLRRKCAQCQEEAEKLRRKADGKVKIPETASEVPSIVYDVLRSPGQPLEERTLSFMESRLGYDFRNVRVSFDDSSAAAADALQARAFTVGDRIVFGRNEYAPDSPRGHGLIAHELVHAAQQRSSPSSAQASLRIGAVDDPQEREADLGADAVLGAGRAPALTASALKIRREPQGSYKWEWKGDNEGLYTSPGGAKYTVARSSKPVRTPVPTQFIPGVDFAKVYVTITWCKKGISGTAEAGVDITNQLQQLVPQILASGDPAKVLRDANLTPYVQLVAIQSEKGKLNFDIQADVGRQGVSAVRGGVSVETPLGKFGLSGGVILGPGGRPTGGEAVITIEPGRKAEKVECETTTFEDTFECRIEQKVPAFDMPVTEYLPSPPRTEYLYFDFAKDIVTTSSTDYGTKHPNIVARNVATFAGVRQDINEGYRISGIKGFTSPEGPMDPKGTFEGNERLAQERADKALKFLAEDLLWLYSEQASFTPSKAAIRPIGGGTRGELYTKVEGGKEAVGKELAETAVPEFLKAEAPGLTDKEREALARQRGVLAQAEIVYPLLRRAEITLLRGPVQVTTKLHIGETTTTTSVACPAEVEQAAKVEFKKHDQSPKTP